MYYLLRLLLSTPKQFSKHFLLIQNILIEEVLYDESYLDSFSPTLVSSAKEKEIIKYSKGRYKFHYVGLIVIDGIIIYILPKYFEGNFPAQTQDFDFPKYYNTIFLKALKSSDFLINSEPFELISDNTFSLYLELLEYYQSYGLYKPVNSISTNSYEDRVNWPQTVSLRNPVFVNKQPLYLDVISRRNKTDDNHIITELQAYATSKAFKDFGQYVTNDNISVDAEDFLEFYDLDYINQILNSKLNETFLDHEIHLLHLLKDFIDEKNKKASLSVKLFGTRAFYYIWESACRSIFVHSEVLKNRFFNSTAWFVNNRRYLGSGKLIPDILSLDNNTYYILDAKYYRPKFEEKKARNEPGTESISKQIIYELTVKNHFQFVAGSNIYSGFIFPSWNYDDNVNDEFSVLDNSFNVGKVNYRGTALPSINLLTTPVHCVFNAYLKNNIVTINL